MKKDCSRKHTRYSVLYLVSLGFATSNNRPEIVPCVDMSALLPTHPKK